MSEIEKLLLRVEKLEKSQTDYKKDEIDQSVIELFLNKSKETTLPQILI